MMKRSPLLYTPLWLLGIVVLLCGCTGSPELRGQIPDASGPSSSVPVTQLKPEGALPLSCPATPVYQGGYGNISGTVTIPWVLAQPVSSGILGYLFYAQGATTKSGTYRFLHPGGSYPDGSATKILWVIDHPQSSGQLHIDGTNLSSPGNTFHQTIPGKGEIPSIVVVPGTGCWRLQITSGNTSGAIILWVTGR